MTITDAGDETEDPNWRFDPDNPPDKFTRRMLGRMSIRHLLLCADRERSPLSEAQQESFDEAYAELNRDVSKHIGTAVQAAMPKVDFNWPTEDIDLGTLAPKTELTLLSIEAYETLSESTKASFERIRRNLTAHLDAARMIRLPPFAMEEPSGGLQESDEPSELLDGSNPRSPLVEPEPAADPGQLRDVTPDELLVRVDEDVSQLAQLHSVVDLLRDLNVLMRKQGDVVRRQEETAARGLLFYVVVGLGSTLSGIATLVGLGTGTERLIAVVLTAGVALLAWLAYRRKPSKPQSAAG